MNNKLYCTAPWNSLHTSAAGLIKPCCVSSLAIDRIGKGEGLGKAYNSEKLTAVRKQILDGAIPETCKICKYKDSLGVKSRRFTFDSINEDKYHLVDPLGHPELVQYLDISFSNLCNLKCRFCGPFCSTKWIEDIKHLPDDNDPMWEGYKIDKWQPVRLDPHILFDEIKNFPNLENIFINGGEPFLSKEHLEFLKLLVESGKSENIRLYYTTNGTIDPTHLLPLFSTFKGVKVSISSEGTGDIYRYSRGHNGAEDQLEKTIQTLKQEPKIRIAINYTLCAINIFGVNEFWSWFRKMEAAYGIDLHFGSVMNPEALQISILPKWFRKMALDELPDDAHPILDKIRNILTSGDNVSEAIQENKLKIFWKFVNTIDKIQGIYLLEKQPIYREVVLGSRDISQSL